MNPLLKRVLQAVAALGGTLLVAVLGLAVYVQSAWDNPHIRPVPDLKAQATKEAIDRGEYLFKYTHACWGCHSTGKDANAPPSGGRVFDLRNIGPGFGIYYSSNITPDEGTGLGTWTDGEIVQAMREGVRKGGKALFPLMPIEAFRGLSDEDALAIVSYLRSIPPVRNPVKPSEPSFLLKALFTFGVIKPEAPITQPILAPPQGVTVDYGRYLANNAAGCMDCHTPRNLEDGSFYRDSLFAGSSIEFGKDEEGIDVVAYARNITSDKETGIGLWTEEQFLDAVRAGVRPDGRVLSTHMPYAYYGLMNEDDLKAIYLYLQSTPPLRRTTPPPAFSERYRNSGGIERGKIIFDNACATCHGSNGKGAPPTGAVLADVAPSLDDRVMKDFIRAGNVGLRMPSFEKSLTTEEIDDVVAYIRSVSQP